MIEKLKKLAAIETEIMEYFGCDYPQGSISDCTKEFWYADARSVFYGPEIDTEEQEEFMYDAEVRSIHNGEKFTLLVVDIGCGTGPGMMIFDNFKFLPEYEGY
jgi:hypothetical protein